MRALQEQHHWEVEATKQDGLNLCTQQSQAAWVEGQKAAEAAAQERLAQTEQDWQQQAENWERQKQQLLAEKETQLALERQQQAEQHAQWEAHKQQLLGEK